MHADHVPASMRHSKLEPDSVLEKLKAAVVLLVEPFGPDVIDVSGGVASTVKVRLAGVASRFPAGSVARTSTVCRPSPRLA